MPKRKKVVDVKVEVPDDYETTQIKTECDSQEVKGTPENDGNPFSRNLRPRKTKCYAEKESPDLEERRVPKVPRRKRRIGYTASENAAPEPDRDMTEQNKIETQQKVPEKPPVKPVEQPRPELKKTILDAVNLPFRDIRLELENLQFPIPSAGPTLSLASKLFSSSNTNKTVAEIKPNHTRKRPKKVVLERKIKTEPLDVPATSNENYSETNPAHGAPNLSTNGNDNQIADSTAPKPKPKRKRKKPQPTSSDKPSEVTQNEPVVIKVEAEVKVDNDDDQVCDNAEGECKTAHPAGTKKSASRIRSKGKGDASTSEVGSKHESDEICGEEKDSVNEGSLDKKPSNATACKRPKNRSKLLPIAPNDAATTSAPAASTNVVDEQSKPEDEIRDLDADDDTSFPSRRSFPRGRKSKLLSSRTGRKEVIHTDEAIDLEDIRGFEHVERYAPPAGARLPKFWDSEDEVSDDESNDNFRRIMCGFGTNCRIHEVIRPASEIVRRLKELQNTFGGTRTLPLFHHGSNEPSDANHENSVADARNGGKKMPILWHNDPVYFKYANNFP